MPASSSDPFSTADLNDVAKADATRSVSELGTIVGLEPRIAAAAESAPTPTTRYILGAEIARGGMGIIYAASDTRLEREVALKVLPRNVAFHSTMIRRFADEALIAAQLQHPAIPPIHDLGTLPDGRQFLAMKLIEGETLHAMLAARKSPDHDRGRFVAVFEQICQALAYAHSHRVIHRDLKPINVMVGKFGEVQVMDWGLAKVLRNAEIGTQNKDLDATTGTEIPSIRDSDGMKTEAGSVLGTPAFMPPEQAVGAIKQIDERSDVFGLGAILAVVLTGQPPFVGNTAETTRILAAQGKVGDCLARLNACGADPGLVALCKRCLAPLREDRPGDAAEVAKAVAELRSAADERARHAELERIRSEGERAKAETEAREQRKRRYVQMALAVAVGLLLFGCGAFAWWQDRQAIAQRDRLARNAEAVTTLLAQAREALKEEDPDRAEVALLQAEKRFGDGGADCLKEGLCRLRADLVLVRELDRIDNIRWTPLDGHYPDPATLAPLWMAAFVSFGIVPGKTSEEEIAAMLSESAIRERALSALDRWLVATHSADVAAVLAFADSDSFRAQIREAVLLRNANRVGELAQMDAALAQPAWFVALTSEMTVPLERRRVLLERALASKAGNLTLLSDLGSLYPINQKAGSEDRIRWFQAAVSTHPRIMSAWNNLGVALLDKEDRDGAIACFKEAIRLDPKDTYPRNNLGNALNKKGDLDGAIDCYKEVIRLNPKYAQAHNGLGWTLKDKGDLDGAIICFKEAIRLDPKDTIAYFNLGLVLTKKGDLDGAATSYKQATQVDPKNAIAHFNLGIALIKKGDLDGAIASYKEAIQINPNHAPAHSNLGSALKAKGDLNGAIECFKEAIRLDPKFIPLHCNLGNALKARGDLTGAIACFKEAIRLDPNYLPAHDNLGWTLRDKGDLNGAIDCFKEAIRLDPKYAPAHNSLGWALKGKGDLNSAIDCFNEAIRLDPNYANAFNNLACTLLDKGDLDGVIANCKIAIRLDRKYAQPHYNMGLAFKGKGDLDGAINCFKETIRLDPKNAQAQKNLLQTTQWRSLVPRLEEVADGRDKPKTAIEACNLAMLSTQTFRKQYAMATRLYAHAFADNPKLADDLGNVIRYNAACCAVLAGCGKGVDAPADADARLALRCQALGWLQADLALRASQARSDNPAGRQNLVQHLNHYLNDPDLAEVRPGSGRMEMSTGEKADWDAFWVDVQAVLAEAQKPPSPRPIAPLPREGK